VYNLSSKKFTGPEIRELGEVKLKNISREIRAYEIMTNGQGRASEEPPKSRSTTDQSNTNQSTKSHAPHEPKAPGAGADGSIDVHALKALVLAEIKRLGQRLTADQIRGWYTRPFPRGLEDALEALEERGFLAAPGTQNTRKPQSSESYRPRTTEDSFDRGIQEFKKATVEIGRELRNAFRNADQWLNTPNQPATLQIPSHRSDGGDDNQDKKVERLWDRALESPLVNPEDEAFLVSEYRKQTQKSADTLARSFRGHLGSYLGVNSFLFILWVTTSGIGSFPWFAIPLLAWGIGMVSHWGAFSRRRREVQEINALPGLTKIQLGLVRRLHKARAKWQGSAIGTFSTGVVLGFLNLITSPMVPWSLIPIGIMSMSTFGSAPAYRSREAALLEDLSKEGVPVQVLKSSQERKSLMGFMPQTSEQATPMEMEASRLRAVILNQLKNSANQNPLGEDFPKLLDDYVVQIADLSRKLADIRGLTNEMAPENLERELAHLQEQMAQTTSPSLVTEYQRGIDQIKRQQSSFQDLATQEKVLSLRLANAMKSLRQIQVELVRLDSLSKPADRLNLDGYVEDLRAGYQALESSDFAELERFNFPG